MPLIPPLILNRKDQAQPVEKCQWSVPPPQISDHNDVYFSLILQPKSYVFAVRFGSLRYLSFCDFSEMCDRLTMTKKGCHE